MLTRVGRASFYILCLAIYVLYIDISFLYALSPISNLRTTVHVRYQNKIRENKYSSYKEEKQRYYAYTRIRHLNGLDFSFAFQRQQDRIKSIKKESSLDYTLGSFGLYFKSKDSKLKLLAIGDYILNIGQHLVYGKPYYSSLYDIRKHPFKKKDYGAKRYTYPGALGTLRGVAFSLSLGKYIGLMPFFFVNERSISKRRFVDNKVNIDFEHLVSSNSWADYKAKDNKVHREYGYGFNTFFKKKGLKLGLLFSYITLSTSLNRAPKYKDVFRGDSLFQGSFYFDTYFLNKSINLFSETALSAYYDTLFKKYVYGYSSLFGGIIRKYKFAYTFLVYYLDKDYRAPHSSEVLYSRKDELGIVNGVRFSMFRDLSIQLFASLFKPSSLLKENTAWFYNLELRSKYNIFGKVVLSYLSAYRYKHYYSTKRVWRKQQADIVYKFYKNRIRLKFRYENIYSKKDDEDKHYWGNLFYTQFSFLIKKSFYFYTRITYYKSKDYDANLYIYEEHLSSWYSPVVQFGYEGIKYDFIIKVYANKAEMGIRWNIDNRINGNIYNALYLNFIYRL